MRVNQSVVSCFFLIGDISLKCGASPSKTKLGKFFVGVVKETTLTLVGDTFTGVRWGIVPEDMAFGLFAERILHDLFS